MGKENLRVAVVGLGKMGLLHASILNVLPNVELVAFCDKSTLIRKFFKKVFKTISIVDDAEKLADLSLDVVYVTTPIPSHYPVVKIIYSTKTASNLFVEKTLASSYEKAKELCELAHRFGGTNMVGYMKRFAVTFNKAKDLLAQNATGKLISFNAHAYSSDFSNIEENTRVPASRGGVLRDLGGHIIDLTLWMLGDFQVESAQLKSLSDDSSEDSAHFAVKQSESIKGDFNVSWCMENYRMPELGLSIKGSNGVIEVNDDKLSLKLNNGKSSIWYRHTLGDSVGFSLGGTEYFREDNHFIKSILDGHNAEPSFDTASKVDFVIDKVKEKAKESE